MTSAIKYSLYGLFSALLLALPFLLLPLPIFKVDDLNPLLLLFVVNPLVLILQGLLSELTLKGKAKLFYIIAAPFVGIALITAFYFAYDTDTALSFAKIFAVVGELFKSPMTIFSLIYVVAAWLGMISVKIFKKLREIFSTLLNNGR